MSESAPEPLPVAEPASPVLTSGLPFAFAQSRDVLLERSGAALTLHYVPPLATDVLLEVRRYVGEVFSLEPLDEDQFRQRLSVAYQRTQNEAAQMAEDLSSDIDLSRLVEELPDVGDLMDADDDAPIIRLINAILSQAVKEQASDIHIETFEERLSVRYRVDGVLSEVLSPKRTLAPLLVSRLKVMAKLDIAEKRVPQDGRISVRIAGHGIDIRMSTIPSAYGERVVLRLLDKQAGQLNLSELQMNEQVDSGYRGALASPHGISLGTGPTGSGKTTTRYAGLSSINESSRNILTIEDPVEFVHRHKKSIVNQREVGVDTRNWHNALKNTLRQAPDVILIGEIRDRETMEHAISFAETGHLCISTLHANNANQALDRIINFFPEEKRQQLLMDLSLNLQAFVSQRLIPNTEGGRSAAVEVMLGSPTVKELILRGDIGGLKEIMGKSKDLGMKTFDMALFDLCQAGEITEDEALRNADSENNLRLRLKLAGDQGAEGETTTFSLEDEQI